MRMLSLGTRPTNLHLVMCRADRELDVKRRPGDMYTRGRAQGEQASRASKNADGGSGDMNCCRIRQTHTRHLHLVVLALLLSGQSFVLLALVPSLCHTRTSIQR